MGLSFIIQDTALCSCPEELSVMKTISMLALCAPVLFAVSACSEPAEPDATATDTAAMPMDTTTPATDPAMDTMATDDAMMADPSATESPDAMSTDMPTDGETPAEGM